MKRTYRKHNRKNSCTLIHFLLSILIYTFPTLAKPIAEGADKFLGNIVQGSVPSNFDSYWNQVTVENGAKWGMVETPRDQMNWAAISTAYNYARSKGFPYKQHTFVWGTQAPGWMSGLSAAEQKAEVEEWVKAYGEKFSETEFIDVVNEPLNTPPSFKNALGGEGETGWDWVVTSFEMAREHCPNARLLINEYEIEYDATLAAEYLKIIMILKDRGLVDGIGIQCHTNEIQRDKPTVEAIKEALDTLASSKYYKYSCGAFRCGRPEMTGIAEPRYENL
ncbi:MAG: endo-1,4-beta-xylanase [Chitinispirillaceae bacterium]|nr:endo-1,4-beta-xylanase [Chitinispirillaceae bacterium]